MHDVNARSDAGETPLHRAAQAHSPLMATLLAAGADAAARDGRGNLPLHLALRPSPALRTADNPAALKALVAKTDLTARDQFGLTPLLLALIERNTEARELIVAGGAQIDKTTQTFAAAAQNDGAKLSQLLTEKPFLATTRLSNGWTPLHVAALWTARDAASVLLQKGAGPNARDAQGATPLHRALPVGGITKEVRELVALLLEKGADVNAYAGTEPPVAAGNAWRSHLVDTPLNRAIVAGNQELVSLFIAKGANLRDRTTHGDTPLLVAIKSGQAELAPLLIAAGADVNARDEVDMTPLTRVLAGSGNEALATLLIEKGADVNFADPSGATPLMRAAMRGSEPLIRLLVAKKADVTARTTSGESALGAAKRHGHTAIIELLKQSGVPE